jgi:hypothetical protein
MFSPERLRSDYHFSGLVPFRPSATGIFLGLLKVDRIPPHLVLCVGEKYFSLEKDRCIVNGDLPMFIAKLSRNRTACLFLRLPDIPKGTAIHLANGCYLRHAGADGTVTCLDPLKHFTSKAFSWDTEQAQVVFDVMDEVLNCGSSEAYAHLNIPSGEVSLKRYTREEVAQHIAALG